jgi:hypothetical protein
MAKLAQSESGAVKTARQLGIRALPADTLFECELYEVLRWNDATGEMQRHAETVWKSRDIIDGKRYALPITVVQGSLGFVSRMRRRSVQITPAPGHNKVLRVISLH